MSALAKINNCTTQIHKEENFCYEKYLIAALVIAAVAGSIFSLCAPAAIALFTIASWNLLSAGVVILNQVDCATWAEKPINRMYVFITEVNSIIASAALFPLTLFPCYHSAKGSLEGEPILMVNGYLSFGSTWDYQRKMLVNEGFGPIYTINVGTGSSIKTYAQEI